MIYVNVDSPNLGFTYFNFNPVWILRMLARHYAVLTKYYLAEFQSKIWSMIQTIQEELISFHTNIPRDSKPSTACLQKIRQEWLVAS